MVKTCGWARPEAEGEIAHSILPRRMPRAWRLLRLKLTSLGPIEAELGSFGIDQLRPSYRLRSFAGRPSPSSKGRERFPLRGDSSWESEDR